MDLFNYLISLTPFWTIPVMVISVQMGWTFKKRAKKTSLQICIFAFLISAFFLGFFVWSGTPTKAVHKMSDFFYLFEN